MAKSDWEADSFLVDPEPQYHVDIRKNANAREQAGALVWNEAKRTLIIRCGLCSELIERGQIYFKNSVIRWRDKTSYPIHKNTYIHLKHFKLHTDKKCPLRLKKILNIKTNSYCKLCRDYVKMSVSDNKILGEVKKKTEQLAKLEEKINGKCRKETTHQSQRSMETKRQRRKNVLIRPYGGIKGTHLSK